jgi:zinc transporter 9
LFSIGCGLGLSHAWHSLAKVGTTPPPAAVDLPGFSIAPLWIAIAVLLVALMLDGYSLYVALHEFVSRLKQKKGERGFLRALLRSDDPTLVAVVLEDSVATLGILLAATGIVLSAVSGNPYWDIGFSMVIAVLLGLTAFFLGSVNMRYLADVRDKEAEAAFVEIVEQHPDVERFHDLRSIIIDDRHTLLVAEIELREEAVVAGLQVRMTAYENGYLTLLSGMKHQDRALRDYCHTRAAALATLERTEVIIDELARAISKRLPRVRHVTLEVEGLAAAPVLDKGDQYG